MIRSYAKLEFVLLRFPNTFLAKIFIDAKYLNKKNKKQKKRGYTIKKKFILFFFPKIYTLIKAKKLN